MPQGDELAEVKTRYGVLTTPDIQRDMIGRFLQHYGEWGWDEAGFVASVLSEGARILDVGAFLGTFGLGVARRASVDFVCFVEANTAVTAALACNVQRNSIGTSLVVDALVGDAHTQPHPGYADTANLGSTSFADDAAGAVTIDAPAAVTTLSRLRAEHGPFDLVKLDTEGMELPILQEDADHLSRGETTLWVECNENSRSLRVAELLLSWGLDVYYFAFPVHNPDNLRGATTSIFPMAYEAGLLAAPKRPPSMDAELAAHRCILQPIWSVEDLRAVMWRTPRWGLPEWEGRGAEQVAALAGRALRGDSYDVFLGPDWAPGEMLWRQLQALETKFRSVEAMAFERLDALQASHQRCAQIEADLRAVETLAVERLAELEEERARCTRAEAALASASALALDRLADLGRMKERATALHDQAAAELRLQRDRAEQAERLLAAVQQSTTWRLVRPIQRLVGAHPFLHRVLRGGRKAAGTLARRTFVRTSN
jgi:FkbM family methyltransferase